MSLMLPADLVFVLNLIGFNWPTADEDKLRESARHWREYASELQAVMTDVNQIVEQVRSENSAESIDALEQHWRDFSEHLRKAHDAAGTVAEVLDDFAIAVEVLKGAVIGQLGLLAGELAATTGAAFLTFGAAEAAAPEEILLTQGVMRGFVRVAIQKVERLIADKVAKRVVEHFLSIKNGLKALKAAPTVLKDFAKGLVRGGVKDLKHVPQHVFWSGKGTEAAAEEFAKTHGGVTLGMTAEGQAVARAAKDLPYATEGRALWAAASKKFAETASGEVHMFRAESGVKPDSIWATVEYKALLSNKQVTNIVYHVVRG
jgi:hypothetical protein